MKLIKRNAILLALFSILFSIAKVTAQEKLPGLLGQYLVEIQEIDSAIYDVNKRHTEKFASNYYIHKQDTFRLDTTELIFIEFASYRTHIRPHLALIKTGNIDEHCIIDCSDLQSDLKKVFDFLNTFSVGNDKELEVIRVRIVKRIMEVYPEYWNVKMKLLNNRN